MALLVGSLAWLVALAPERAADEVLPTTRSGFSLDLEVVDSIDHSVIYAVEQRARPNYRILSFEPATGAVETVFEVPADAIIYDITLSPDRASLAVGYSPDYAINGSGVSVLDLASGEFREVIGAETGTYMTDLSWTPDGSEILATHVDRTTEVEGLSMVGVDLGGNITMQLDTGIEPVATTDGMYYLTLDDDNARRSIGFVDSAGETHIVEVEDGNADLGHLAAHTSAGEVSVAVIEEPATGLTLGEAAEAHGNHDVPSQWFTADPEATIDHREELGEAVVYDAAATPDSIVYATREGISIATSERVDVIESRAIRLVAA